MNRYRVASGTAKFGPGQKMLLTAAQIEGRAHVLDVPKDHPGKTPAEVTTAGPVEFKAGEIIGLPELERRHVDMLVPLDEPKTDNERTAVIKDNERKAAAGKPVQAKAKGKSGR